MNKDGDKVSKLKEVDDEWILRRLERWGERSGMPFLGPEKGAILQEIVSDKAPRTVVEGGGMCGYSAIKLAQALPPGENQLAVKIEHRVPTWLRLCALSCCTGMHVPPCFTLTHAAEAFWRGCPGYNLVSRW